MNPSIRLSVHRAIQVVISILVISSPITSQNISTSSPELLTSPTNVIVNTTTSTTIPPTVAYSSTLSRTFPGKTTLSPRNNNSTSSSGSNGTTSIPPDSPTKLPSASSIYCPCDLQLSSCDINCCCDPDCNENERAVFSSCEDPEINNSAQNRHHCHRKDYFYRNNTPFYMEVHQNGLFCIVTNNLNKEEQIPELPLDIEAALKMNKPRYAWNVELNPFGIWRSEHSSGYKFGSKIETIKVHNSSEYEDDTLWLPSGFYGTSCTAKQPIQFLKDAPRSFCQDAVSNLTLQCSKTARYDVSTFLQDTYIIQNPKGNLTVDNVVNFTYLECQNVDLESSCSNVDELKAPYLDLPSLSCTNVLEILDLSIVHRGIEGIAGVTAKIQYKNYSTLAKEIRQQFRATFEWSKKRDDAPKYFQKSGNPGYIIGKPVIAGMAVVPEKRSVTSHNTTQEDVERDAELVESNQIAATKRLIVQSSEDMNNWMMIPSSGVCDGTRKPVLFGMNVNVMCTLDLAKFSSCQALQYQIGKILLGVSPENFNDRYVSTFGNPTFPNMDNWVPIQSSEHPFGQELSSSFTLIDSVGCDGIVSSLHIPIVFARVGSVNFPQSKILSVLLEYGPPISIPKKTLRGNLTRFIISSTVSFLDTSLNPTTKIPQWPVISIKLPTDFFYPFSSSPSKGCRIYGYYGIELLSVLLVLLLM